LSCEPATEIRKFPIGAQAEWVVREIAENGGDGLIVHGGGPLRPGQGCSLCCRDKLLRVDLIGKLGEDGWNPIELRPSGSGI
jgi:hypothetical protein